MFKTRIRYKIVGVNNPPPLCSRCCSQVEDITIVHWVGVGLSQLSLVFAESMVINVLIIIAM